jgi:hypothetical protein
MFFKPLPWICKKVKVSKSKEDSNQFRQLRCINKNKLAWKLVQDVVGVKLQGKEFGNNSVAEELDSELDETSLATMRDDLSGDSDEHTYKVATQKAHYGKESNLNKIEIPKQFKNEWEYQQWVGANKQKSKNIPAMAEGGIIKAPIKVPTEDGIGWQDIRLLAGEGKLTQKTIKQAIDIIRKQRREKQGVAEDQLEEKWSQKYKRSIDCSNPRGFSQRAHCQGRKK